MKNLILSLCCFFIFSNLIFAEDKISKIFVFKKDRGNIVFSNILPINAKKFKLVKIIELHKTSKKNSKNREVDFILKQVAKKHKIDYHLLKAVAVVESGLKPYAKSSKGATGIMQLMPQTAKRFGVTNISNVQENIQGGAKYLKYLLKKFNYNYRLALAAYNAGEHAVLKYKSIPPYRETRNYVKKVFLRYKKYLSNEKIF